MFWIAYEDVLRFFDCIDICKVRKGWNEVRVSGVLPPFSSKVHQTCTLLTVLEPTEVEFSLFQEGQRNSERTSRSQLDLCVVIFRSSTTGSPQLGKLVNCSKRQVRGFVGTHSMLEPGYYLVVCMAFNHWQTGNWGIGIFSEPEEDSLLSPIFNYCFHPAGDSGDDDVDNYPEYVLAMHSSKRLLVETLNSSYHLLGDAIINLTLAKGKDASFVPQAEEATNELIAPNRAKARRQGGDDGVLPDQGLGRAGGDDREPARGQVGAGQVRLPGELQRRQHQGRPRHRRRRAAASQVS